MIVILLNQNTKDTVVFSSITAFSENYSASVTSHPVESGKSVSDNITNENPKFSLSGVISDFDYYNPVKEVAYGVSADYEDSILNKFNLSYFENGKFVSVADSIPSEATSRYIKKSLLEAREVGTLFGIFIYNDDNKFEKNYPNCAITSLSFKAETDTEFCIYPEMSLEQLNIVDVLVEKIAKNKIPDLPIKSMAAAPVDKGKVDECLEKMKTEDDGTLKADTTKQKIAKGQRPKSKCDPSDADTAKLKQETWIQTANRHMQEQVDANAASARATEAYRLAVQKFTETGKGVSNLQTLQAKDQAARLYADKILPEKQSLEAAIQSSRGE